MRPEHSPARVTIMTSTLAATLLGTTVTAALLLGASSSALADEPSARSSTAPRTLSSVQALGAAATASRISALDRAIPRVTANQYLSATDKDHILGTLNGDRSAMVTLAAKIAADTEITVATADYRSIFTGYRVFAVAIPQSLYASAASGLGDSAIPALRAAQTTLAAALAGPLAAKDTPAIDASMADLDTQIQLAEHSISGVSAFALSVTPDQFNADHDVLSSTRASVTAATAAAQKARSDVASVKAALQ